MTETLNRLAQSHSPYLLQHQRNPVDWYPWGDEAFQTAKDRDLPIFLSVGYAACHWCHVMEHESFENETIAAYLNQHFVSVKVDREERPDVDSIYMNAVQVISGRGGWPMSVFLDHDGRPFYAGTYWPPARRGPMPGFVDILEAIHDAWTNRRDSVAEHCQEMTAALKQLSDPAADENSGAKTGIDDRQLARLTDAATERLLGAADRTDGGFGSAPKFPHATDLQWLCSVAGDAANEHAANAGNVLDLTLDRMARGGIRDHLGGGFARYSVDGIWLVPHFEKMLYDNALLLGVYARRHAQTERGDFAEAAHETARYMMSHLSDPAGGFWCSQDADSEGEEGKFYVWTPEQVTAVLGEERGQVFCDVYDVRPGGNFEGKSILWLPRPTESMVDEESLEKLRAQLCEDRHRLERARVSRTPPGTDDKVITAWNGLAIEAFAVAGAIMDQSHWIDRAMAALTFVRDTMHDGDRLWHAYRRGHRHLDGLADDHANVASAAITVAEVTGEMEWLLFAETLADQLIERFWDSGAGGFFYTGRPDDRQSSLLVRQKEWHDGSLISANAAAVTVLLRLSDLTDRTRYRDIASATISAGRKILDQQSMAAGALVSSAHRLAAPPTTEIIAVQNIAQWQSIRSEIFRSLPPHVSVFPAFAEADNQPAIARDKRPIDGAPARYRCVGTQCNAPDIIRVV